MVDNKALQVENNINYLQFNEISELLCKNFEQSGLELYLKEYFKDLVRRSGNENKENAISKLAFIESVKLPMIIAERLFYSFTSNRYAIEITKDQYTQGFINLYSNDIDIRMNVICKIFDFDLNGIVNVDDVTLIFAQFYVLGDDNDMSTFSDIKEIIHKDLTPRKKMTTSSFKEIMNNYNPDALYLFCFYLNLYCPFTEEQINYFIEPKTQTGLRKDSMNHTGIVSNSSIKVIEGKNYFSSLIGEKKVKRTKVNAEPTHKLTSYFKRKYNIIIEQIDIVNNNNEYKDLGPQNENEDSQEDFTELNELEEFEKELYTTISTIDKKTKIDQTNTNNTTNTENSISRKGSDIDGLGSFVKCQYKTINTDSFLSPAPFMRSILKSPTKSPLTHYSKVRSQLPFGNTNTKDTIPKYQNHNNNYEITVNYYTRSGAVRDCKIIIIDDCLYVHIFNGVAYKFLKIISLKFSYVEEIEQCETLSNNSLFRIKISSFLNKNYNEIIFSSQDHLHMKSFLNKLQIITEHKEIETKYEKEKEIYRGSMSSLFLGKDLTNGNKVAIKQVNLNACDKRQSYETILWENDLMKFLQKTSHPNIVKTFDIYRNNDYFLFVIEYLPSGNLKSYLLENRNKLSYKELKCIMHQIATAVLFLHSNGIIHRDLKPERILVKKKENNEIEIKLIDFGFGKILGRCDFVNEPYGTFYYASPEILNKTPYGFKTDIWSLGVILFLIVVGIHPFGESDKDLKIIQNSINTASYSFPDNMKIETKIKEMIELCLKVDPKVRPKIEDIVKVLI